MGMESSLGGKKPINDKQLFLGLIRAFKEGQEFTKNKIDAKNPNSLFSLTNKLKEFAERSPEGIKAIAESSDFNETFSFLSIGQKIRMDRQQLDAVLPELYKAGLVDERSYGKYISTVSDMDGFEGVNRTIERTPLDVASKVKESGIGEFAMRNWLEKATEEITREQKKLDETASAPEDGTSERPARLLELCANAMRFMDDDQRENTKEAFSKAIDDYKTKRYRIEELRDRTTNKYPALENLCQAGYSEQVLDIIGGAKYNPDLVLEFFQKGYFSEEQAQKLFKEAGLLR